MTSVSTRSSNGAFYTEGHKFLRKGCPLARSGEQSDEAGTVDRGGIER
jgi:hypothetical protein